MDTPGTLALVGGGEWSEGCTFDAEFLAASGADEVLVLPTAAAYEHPERLVVRAGEWFEPLGRPGRGPDGAGPGRCRGRGPPPLPAARFIYLAGGSPMHLRSVLKNSAVFEALLRGVARRRRGGRRRRGPWPSPTPWSTPGAAGSPSGSGLLATLAVVPHFGDVHEDAHGEKLHRSVAWPRPARRWPASPSAPP